MVNRQLLLAATASSQAELNLLEAVLGIEVFFCDPHAPWQRPTNEHTNGLLRRWLPKGTPLDLNPLRLSVIEDSLNWMPRRIHNWQSAADVCTQLTRNHR